jgi:hypothetical protein
MLESELERKVVALCRSQQIATYKFVSPANRGVPDRIILCNGKAMFLELKQEGKKPTRLQYYEMDRLHETGCRVCWADNFDDARIVILHFVANA